MQYILVCNSVIIEMQKWEQLHIFFFSQVDNSETTMEL